MYSSWSRSLQSCRFQWALLVRLAKYPPVQIASEYLPCPSNTMALCYNGYHRMPCPFGSYQDLIGQAMSKLCNPARLKGQGSNAITLVKAIVFLRLKNSYIMEGNMNDDEVNS